MLLNRRTLDTLSENGAAVTFRRWAGPRVNKGGSFRTRAGVVRIESIVASAPMHIKQSDVEAAGFRSHDAILKSLKGDETWPIYRIELRLVGPDPRIALRNSCNLSVADIEAILARLRRFDKSSRTGPWTEATLQIIAERSGTRAPELAASLGRDTKSFKSDVRKLKELGLTISLDVGYRLSPRGEAFRESQKT